MRGERPSEGDGQAISPVRRREKQPPPAQNVGYISYTQKEACGSRKTAAGFLHRVLNNKCVWPFAPIFLQLKIPTIFSFVLHFLLDSSGRRCYNNRGRFVKKITMISFRMFLFRRAYIAGERGPASGKAGEKSIRFFCFFPRQGLTNPRPFCYNLFIK